MHLKIINFMHLHNKYQSAHPPRNEIQNIMLCGLQGTISKVPNLYHEKESGEPKDIAHNWFTIILIVI